MFRANCSKQKASVRKPSFTKWLYLYTKGDNNRLAMAPIAQDLETKPLSLCGTNAGLSDYTKLAFPFIWENNLNMNMWPCSAIASPKRSFSFARVSDPVCITKYVY